MEAKSSGRENPAVEDFNVEALQQLLLLLAAVLALIGIAAYTITYFRRKLNARSGSSSEMLGNFREMHERGMLSDEEFRTIKTRMASRLRAEISRSDETA